MTEISYRDDLMKIMSGELYNGCGIVVMIGKYIALGKSFDTLALAKEHIDKSIEHLKKSIKK